MTLLDRDKLEELEEEFEQHPDGIELINFVWLMKSALSVPKEDEYDLIYGLCRLFSDIDINGDLHMEWSEFTQYIIDTVMKNSTNSDYLQMLKDKNKIGDEERIKSSQSSVESHLGSLKSGNLVQK